MEVAPGVSAVMAAAASAGVPLVTHGQRLAIRPALCGTDDLWEAIKALETAGADRATIWLDNTGGPEALQEMEQIARQVLV
mgnify:CR=1 FL=1